MGNLAQEWEDAKPVSKLEEDWDSSAREGMTHLESSNPNHPTVQSELRNLAGGVIKGISDLAPIRAGQEAAAAVENKPVNDIGLFLKSQGMDVNTPSAKVGEIGTKIAAGIPLLAKVPFAAGATGLGRIKQAALNIPLGAAAGGVYGGYTEGQEGIAPGAVAGSAGAGVFEALKAGGAGIGNVVGPMLPSIDATKYLPEIIRERTKQYLPKALQGETTGAERAVGRIVTDPRVHNAEQISALLRQAKHGETAAQAALPAGSAEFSGLGRIAEANRPSISELVSGGQQKELQAAIGRISKGPVEQEAARTALKLDVLPERKIALDAADLAGKKEKIYRAIIEQKGKSNASAMQNAGQLYSEFGNQTNQAWKTANRKLGAIGDVKVQRNVDRAMENYDAAADFANVGFQRNAEKKFAQYQLDSIAEHGLSPLKADALIGKFDSLLKRDDVTGSALATNVLKKTKAHILENMVKPDGTLSAYAVEKLRQQGVNEIIQNMQTGADKLSKSQTADLLKEIRPVIDDAIESAGGTGWKNYLKSYHEGMKKIEEMTLGKDLGYALTSATGKERATNFANTVRKMEDEFNPETGMPVINSLSLPSRNAVDKVSDTLARNVKESDLAAAGTSKALKILRADEQPLSGVNLLNPKVTITNKIINTMMGRGGEKTTDALSDLMLTNPKRLADIMDNVKPTEKQLLLNAIMQRASTVIPAQQAAQK